MTTVIIGAEGFLGRHLQARMKAAGLPFVALGHAAFSDDTTLASVLAGPTPESVVHLAGVNRGDPAHVEEDNVYIAERLAGELAKCDRAPRLLFANSVHAGTDTPYGRGKRQASAVLAAWADAAGAEYVDLLLPNLYGECGRPEYNSFVATFCHRLAQGTTPVADVDKELELLHAQDAAACILAQVSPDSPCAEVRPQAHRASVAEVLFRLRDIAAVYRAAKLPDLSDPFVLRLFNTYRSYLYPHHFPVPLEGRSDSRGIFYEAAQCPGGSSQTSFSTTKPGITRGNHFHLRKVERFLVLRGNARIDIRPVWGGPVRSFALNGDQPAFVDMPTLFTHNITNTGEDDLYTLFWASELFDPADPDTFAEQV